MTKKERHIVYKRIKVQVEHCNVCKEQLRGEGNLLIPFSCSCGKWVYDLRTNTYKVEEINNE